jgi:hypothetical protein
LENVSRYKLNLTTFSFSFAASWFNENFEKSFLENPDNILSVSSLDIILA